MIAPVELSKLAQLGKPLTLKLKASPSTSAAVGVKLYKLSSATVVAGVPEIVGAYRMTGDLDYVLRVRVADVPAYDAFYKKLTSRISVSDISASFVMEEIKETTAVPL